MFIYLDVFLGYAKDTSRRGVALDNVSYFEETLHNGVAATYFRLKQGGIYNTSVTQADAFTCRETFAEVQSKIAIAQEK